MGATGICVLMRILKARELQQLLQERPDAVHLLDVREDWERQLVSIDGSQHIPLGQLKSRIGELPLGGELAIYCHHGMRSQQAALFLESQGFQTINLQGGINAWATEVDPTLARY